MPKSYVMRKLVESNKIFVIVITWKTSSILDKSFFPIQIVKTTQLKCPNPEKHDICKNETPVDVPFC